MVYTKVTFRKNFPPSPFSVLFRFAFSAETSIVISRCSAPLAQLDRASVYGTEGQGFESLRARSQISHQPADPKPLRSLTGEDLKGFSFSSRLVPAVIAERG